MKDILGIILGLAMLVVFTYGCYWVGKTVSYSVFYEDMVLSSIRGIVKSSCLIK